MTDPAPAGKRTVPRGGGRGPERAPADATRRLALGIVIGLLVSTGAPDPVRAAEPCEAVVGKWKWFTGGVVSINADGTIVHDPGNDGTWQCTDAMRGRATLRWRVGGYVNRLALSADGRALTSADPTQSYVSAQRIGTPRVVEPPARPKPAEPAPRSDSGPPSKPAPGAKGGPKADDATVPSPTPPSPRTVESKTVTPPTDAKTGPESPRPTPPVPGAPSGTGRAGPCSGRACAQVSVEVADRCVWLRSAVEAEVHVELRLAAETVTMTLEAADMAKVVKEPERTSDGSRTARQAATKRRLDELRRQGHNIPYDPKIEGPPDGTPATPATPDRSRAWHGTKYDPVVGRDRPVFHARIDRASGCVTDPGEIRSYRVTVPSAGLQEVEERVIPCTGEACADVDASAEQVHACRFANRGERAIVIGIAQFPNRDVSIQKLLPPNGTMGLDIFRSCLQDRDIGRIEARYK